MSCAPMKASTAPAGIGWPVLAVAALSLGGLPAWGLLIQVLLPHSSSFQSQPQTSTRPPWPHHRGRRASAMHMCRQTEHNSSAVEALTSEILNILFPTGNGVPISTALDADDERYYAPPARALREECGRQAQGYLATQDPDAARALVPPQELTYGEYDLSFFFSLVDQCLSLRAGGAGDRGALGAEARSLVFGDVGSGCGRLVLAQALKWPWKSCRGVEKVASLHDMGEAALSAARRMAHGDDVLMGVVGRDGVGTVSSAALHLLDGMAPCVLSLGDINEEVDLADVDVLFCYSSSFPARGDLLTEFSYTLGHKLRPGTQVITTDRRLVSDGPWEFALLGEREGSNPETGGKSIAYLWEVVKSAL